MTILVGIVSSERSDCGFDTLPNVEAADIAINDAASL